MSALHQLVSRLRAMWRKAELESDMAEEMRLHLERRVEENIAAGMPADDARYAALRQFGSVTLAQERARDQHGFPWFDQLLQDLRYAARGLRRSPGFTSVAVVTLALGLGVNTSVFTLFYAIALRPLPVKDPQSIVSVHQHFTGEFSREIHGSAYLLSYPEYVSYRDNVPAFSDLVAFRETELALDATAQAKFRGLLVSDNYFAALRAEASLGRFFQPGEARLPGAPSIAVLSYGCWQQRFGGDPRVVGRTVRVNGQPIIIVGVASPELRGTELRIPEIWIPLMMQAQVMPGRDYFPRRDSGWLSVFGRLRSGATLETARAQMSVVAGQSDAEYPGRRTMLTLTRGALLSSPAATGKGFPVAIATMVVAGLVMLIACANIASLLLTRAASRQREIGIRLALGAGRGRIVRQLLTETILLALLGGIAGLLLTYWLPSILLLIVPDTSFDLALSPDLAVFAYGFALSTIAGIVFGLAPALDARRLDVNAVLNSGGIQLGRRHSHSRLRSILVVAQVSIALALLVGTGLLVRGLQRAQSIDLGFDPTDLVVVSADMTEGGYDDARAEALLRQLRERLLTMPTIRSAALVAVPPFAGTNTAPVVLERAVAGVREGTPVAFNAVSPEFFSTLGVPILKGRVFTDAEVRTTSPVAVVSQAMAARFWPGVDPIGRRFQHRGLLHEVIGVARNVSLADLLGAERPVFYLPSARGHFLIRTTGDAAGLAGELRHISRAIDSHLFVSVSRTDESIARLLHPLRSGSILALVLGFLALTLAAIGLYGVMAYAVAQRRKEIGVRLALGATRREVLLLVIGQGAQLAAIGIAIGLAISMAISHVLRNALFGLSPLDPIAFVGVSAFLAVVALVACYVPARWAAEIDPIEALRAP